MAFGQPQQISDATLQTGPQETTPLKTIPGCPDPARVSDLARETTLPDRARFSDVELADFDRSLQLALATQALNTADRALGRSEFLSAYQMVIRAGRLAAPLHDSDHPVVGEVFLRCADVLAIRSRAQESQSLFRDNKRALKYLELADRVRERKTWDEPSLGARFDLIRHQIEYHQRDAVKTHLRQELDLTVQALKSGTTNVYAAAHLGWIGAHQIFYLQAQKSGLSEVLLAIGRLSLKATSGVLQKDYPLVSLLYLNVSTNECTVARQRVRAKEGGAPKYLLAEAFQRAADMLTFVKENLGTDNNTFADALYLVGCNALGNERRDLSLAKRCAEQLHRYLGKHDAPPGYLIQAVGCIEDGIAERVRENSDEDDLAKRQLRRVNRYLSLIDRSPDYPQNKPTLAAIYLTKMAALSSLGRYRLALGVADQLEAIGMSELAPPYMNFKQLEMFAALHVNDLPRAAAATDKMIAISDSLDPEIRNVHAYVHARMPVICAVNLAYNFNRVTEALDYAEATTDGQRQELLLNLAELNVLAGRFHDAEEWIAQHDFHFQRLKKRDLVEFTDRIFALLSDGKEPQFNPDALATRAMVELTRDNPDAALLESMTSLFAFLRHKDYPVGEETYLSMTITEARHQMMRGEVPVALRILQHAQNDVMVQPDPMYNFYYGSVYLAQAECNIRRGNLAQCDSLLGLAADALESLGYPTLQLVSTYRMHSEVATRRGLEQDADNFRRLRGDAIAALNRLPSLTSPSVVRL